MTDNVQQRAGRVAMAACIGVVSFVLAACANNTSTGQEVVESVAASAPLADAIEAAANGAHRSDKNIARNAYRNPAQTLSFFGLQKDMRVIEISPGGLWYAEILAPVLKDEGAYIAAGYDPAVPDQPEYRYKQVEHMNARFASEAVFSAAQTVPFSPPASTNLGEPGSADMVVTFRNTHGWVRDGSAEQVFASIYDVLKPGGVLGLVQHRGDQRTLPNGRITGYLSEAAVIGLAEQAGFVLESRSQINANPADTADHAIGVWALPPSLRGDEANREAMQAIGESDRMTLRFRKPAA